MSSPVGTKPTYSTTTSTSYSKEELNNRITVLNKSIDRIESDIYWDNSFLGSSVNNIIDIAEKVWYSCGKSDQEIKSDYYCEYISKKSWIRCIALSIPIVGRVGVYLYDHITSQIGKPLDHLSSEEEILRYVKKQKNKDFPQLTNVSQDLLNNEEFMIKLFLIDQNTFQYADKELKDNADLLLKLIEISRALDNKFNYADSDVAPLEALKKACRNKPSIIIRTLIKMELKSSEEIISFFISIFFRGTINPQNIEKNVGLLLQVCQKNKELYDIFGQLTKHGVKSYNQYEYQTNDPYTAKFCANFWLEAIKLDRQNLDYAMKYDRRISELYPSTIHESSNILYGSYPDTIYALLKHTKDKFWFDTFISKFKYLQEGVIEIAKIFHDHEVLSLIGQPTSKTGSVHHPEYDLLTKLPPELMSIIASYGFSSDLLLERMNDLKPGDKRLAGHLKKPITSQWIAELQELKGILTNLKAKVSVMEPHVHLSIENTLKAMEPLTKELKDLKAPILFHQIENCHYKIILQLFQHSRNWLDYLSRKEMDLNEITMKMASNGIGKTMRRIYPVHPSDFLSAIDWDKKSPPQRPQKPGQGSQRPSYPRPVHRTPDGATPSKPVGDARPQVPDYSPPKKPVGTMPPKPVSGDRPPKSVRTDHGARPQAPDYPRPGQGEARPQKPDYPRPGSKDKTPLQKGEGPPSGTSSS